MCLPLSLKANQFFVCKKSAVNHHINKLIDANQNKQDQDIIDGYTYKIIDVRLDNSEDGYAVIEWVLSKSPY